MRGSIAVLVLFMTVICGFSVSAAETENAEICTEAAEESAEAAGAEVVSVFRMADLEDASEEDTCISSDEETAMVQLESLIPDINFRREVYRSMKTAGQLGTYGDEAHPEYDTLTGEDLYKAVLGDFTGKIYASGYEKETGYIYEFSYREAESETWQTASNLTAPSGTSERAYELMKAMMTLYKNMGYTVDEASASVSSIVTVTDERKPEEELITDITGITLLRHAEKIDVSDNRITSLMPMDVESLDEEDLVSGGFTDLTDAQQKWFGEPFRNVEFDFSGNPIDEFPKYMLGRITVNPTFAQADTQYERKPLIIVKKTDDGTWPMDLVFDMPLVQLGGQPIKYSTTGATGIESLGDSVTYEYLPGDEDSSGSIILRGVEKTGQVYFNASIQMGTGGPIEENQVKWYTAAENQPSGDENENINTNASTVSVRVSQALRVLYHTVPEPAVTNISVGFEKTEFNSKTPVAGAGYTLFKMKTDEEGNLIYQDTGAAVTVDPESGAAYQDQVIIAEKLSLSDEPYKTDSSGKFTLEDTMSPGWYCFIETEAPEEYELDTTPLMFEVGSADVEISGGTTLTDLVFKRLSGEETLSYQLYQKQDDGEFKFYNNDANRYYETDNAGEFQISGLPDGVYQLREVAGEGSAGSGLIEFTVSGDSTEEVVNGGQAKLSFEKSLYTDAEAPVEINLTPDREDMQLQSVTVFWYDSEGEEQSKIFHASDTSDPVSDAEAFINGDHTEVHTEVYGPLSVQPVYLQTGELKAEDPKKVSFSFTKTDGDPSGEAYKGLAGAEFTLYRADEDWNYSEEDVYRTAVSDQKTGIVCFENLDSGQYIMKETKTPDGYASLPGYWKVTADAKSESDKGKLGFLYVRQDGQGVPVSESDMIPEDAYGNHYYIPNQPVSDLPTMGGPGNRTFMFGGILLMGAACILCGFAVRNKKIKNTQ